MNKRYISVLLLALLFIVLPAVAAQDVITIEYGDSVDGEITNTSEAVYYTFSGREGDVVTISAESSSTDVYIQLYDKNGDPLAENDDISNSNLNAEIKYTLDEDGDYFILVLAYNRGDFTLTLESDGTPASGGGSSNTSVSDSGYTVIEDGDTLSGETIDLKNPVIYSFQGEAGQTVVITASSDEVDTYVVLADANSNILAENDDISSSNLNAQIQAVLPANGEYLIGVFGYSAGPFDVSLVVDGSGGGGDAPTLPVSEPGTDESDTLVGELDDSTYYLEYPITVENDGDTVTIDATAVSGDLDTYVGLFLGDDVVAENDDREQGTTDSQLVYPDAEAGDYVIIITRYGFEEGQTSGEFEMSIKISASGTSLGGGTGGSGNVDPVASGYPTLNPTSSIADWTILVYMGGDNNLEDGLENDLDEFEIAGGSTENVRVIVLLDRAEGFSNANGNWTDTRVFEVGRDSSDDARRVYPPTIDTRELFNLGELDTSYGGNLTDFLVWGIQNYPANHYAVSINDHGGAWAGMVTDDTTGPGILSIADLAESFGTALSVTGLDKFDLLINDACLMSSVEYFASVAPYFDYSLSSPEITLNPSFDMTLLANLLNNNPSIDMADLGRQMVNKYVQDMTDLAPDTVPVLGAALTDLTRMPGLMDALDEFTGIVNRNPDAYATMLGLVRTNTYAYSFFLPAEDYGPATNIDLGHFMRGVIDQTRDRDLGAAAEGVVDALGDLLVYGSAGEHLNRWTSYYNIYFPDSGADFSSGYLSTTPLDSWTDMLRSYYNAVSPRTTTRGVTAGAVVAAPSTVPLVSVTNVFPTVTSVAVPTKVSMEVIGRNVSQGTFTVDQIQPDGTLIRLESARIVTPVVIDGVADQINLWKPGIDDFTFTWEVTLNTVTDGTTSGLELVSFEDDVVSLSGRYQAPGSETWLNVTIIFDTEGNTSSVISQTPGGVALASIDLQVGGLFQTFQSTVTPDGRVVSEPGTLYTWPEGGISWYESPAPDGEYNLGFLISALGGTTGFDSTTVTVSNEGVDPTLAGYVDMDWNFMFQRPADWSNVTYFPDEGTGDYESTNDPSGEQFIFVYPVYGAEDDLEAIAREVTGRYDVIELNEDFEPVTVDGRDALAFTFTYEGSDGSFYLGQAFSIYVSELELGLVFSSEGIDQGETDRIYQILLDTLTFFDAQAIKDQDTGLWTYDIYTDSDTYPVRRDWMPGGDEGLFWIYRPDNASEGSTFAAITVLTDESDDAKATLETILAQEVEDLDEYQLLGADTYYADNHTWEWASYTYENDDGDLIAGRLYVTTINGRPYLLRFEAPESEFDQVFRDVFTVMLDGFKSQFEGE